MILAPPQKKLDSWRPPGGGLEDRFRALMHWITSTIPCRSAFIADDNGLPVIEHAAADAGHIATTSSVLLLLVSIRNMMGDTGGGWLSLRMGTGVLHFVEIDTPLGRFGVGIFTNDSLSADVLGPLHRAVERAFSTVDLRNEG